MFDGDPSVHPDIFWCPEEKFRDGKPIPGHFRLRLGEDIGSAFLSVGTVIVGRGSQAIVISPEELKMDWEVDVG